MALLRRPRSRGISTGAAAIVALAIAWALIMHSMGWGQMSNYAQVRALASGRANVDAWHWETEDVAWYRGHFYSVKAPGLAAMTLPAYLALDGLGAHDLSREAAQNAHRADHPHWASHATAPFQTYGYSPDRARAVGGAIESDTALVWVLTLFGAVLPALLLLLLVRSIADRFEPGFGTAAAITLGLGTIVMIFAAEYFPHVASATFGFAAFAVLFHERRGPPRLWLVAAAGLLAGLAVDFEYPLALAGAVFFFYALSRSDRRVHRALVYAACAFIGVVPTLVFNLWAFHDPLHFAYADAIADPGLSGHSVLGLNSKGFFGITVPAPSKSIDLLLGGRGLLTLTPVLVMGIAGAVALRKSSWRAEANVILAICAVFFLYNSGYWLPFGGGAPGPRFLVPILPFIALGLAVAWRRWPALTLGLAIPSIIFMLAATLTYPLLGGDPGTTTWADQLYHGDLEHTLLTVVGVKQGWIAVAPFLAAIGAAVALAVTATPQRQLGRLRDPLAAIGVWALVSTFGPAIAGDASNPIGGGGEAALWLIGVGALCAIVTAAALAYRERRSAPIERAMIVPAPALGERIS